MVTPIGTLSYPALFTPDQYNDNSKPRYKAEIIFDDDTDISSVERALAMAVKDAWPAELSLIHISEPTRPY